MRSFAAGLATSLLVLTQSAIAQIPLPDSYLARLKQAEAMTASLPPAAFGQPGDPAIDKLVLADAGQLQLLGTARSMVGDTDGALAAVDAFERRRQRYFPGTVRQMAQLENAAAEDAIAAIVREARSKRIVLINEAHQVPLHRAFAQRLAAELRKIGYSYLACETFNALGAQAANEKRHIARNNGHYTAEPVFAGFVNAALADGWKLVAYEIEASAALSPAEQVRLREEVQARNLVERIFAKDKDAKVLVFVGFGHLYKAPEPEPKMVMMGEHLRRMTGLPTLHIDQTPFIAHPDAADENPLYAPLLAKYPSKDPIILRNKDGSYPVLLGMTGRLDMQVIHPRYPMQDGRPAWLATLAGRSAVPVPKHLLPASGRRVVKAIPAAAPPDAVPTDILLLEAGKPAPAFMLTGEKYRFETED
ncbi:hypothetical protein [Massilia sp.]|uniref:hypothetical protein n=1 Tax=Massilia sp. TaxID=1882437 RepID=UPI00289A92A9|nr:hypothetical protein [Massilia sp.]